MLLVRAADVPEYVQDGVVDCGITGADLVAESGASVSELLRLGFGTCTLEAAVSAESTIESLDGLGGARVATVYPRLAERLLARRGLEVDLVRVTGSVEVTPRLGLADAIVDLVSSGSTLRTNGLRSLGALYESEAVLVGRAGEDVRARELGTVLRSVVEARGARYLMLNAPESALDEITASRAGLALAEHRPTRRAGDGRRAGARAGRRRVAPPSAAGGSGRLLDPARSGRAHAVVSDVPAIVSDVRARGDAALREWALRLDGVEPARAAPGPGLPEEAVLALASNVRRWHEAQRPSDMLGSRFSPASSSSGAGFRSARSASTFPVVSCRRS